MVASRITLTKTLRRKILGAVRAGAYPHVAAEAFGVSKETLDDWLTHGVVDEKGDSNFADDVREAAAVARLLVEANLYKNEPRTWLIHGPGRETCDRPGWSVPVKPAASTAERTNVLESLEVMQIFGKITNAVEPFPEARDRINQIIFEHNQ